MGRAMLPGMGGMLIYRIAWYVVAGGWEEAISWAQEGVLASKTGKRNTRRMVVGLTFVLMVSPIY